MGTARLGPLVIAACAILSTGFAAVPQEPQVPVLGSVRGKITLTGLKPVRKSWPITGPMRELHTSDTFEDEAWLIGAKGELKNCVITLMPADGSKLKTKPLASALYTKVGPRYEPRVLVVTSGTELTLRNVDSPCNGFTFRSRRGPQLSNMISAGGEFKTVVEGEGPAPILCDLRDYMRGVVFFTETPYYAVSAADGTYRIDAVPPGRYRLRLWHEELGYVNKKEKRLVTITASENSDVSWTIPSPRKE